MKTEVKSLWAATRVSISEKEGEDSAPQHAGNGGTLTAMAMEESLEQAVLNRGSGSVTSVIRPCITR